MINLGHGENIIAKQLLDIRINLENRDIVKVCQLCDELKINIERYQVDKSIRSRIKIITDIAQPSTSNLTLNDRIQEIDVLIDSLNVA
jgi:hypothetical protein